METESPPPGIFFTDLDQTLLTSKKTVSPATGKVLGEMVAAGNTLCLASGRPLPAVLEVRQMLPAIPDDRFWIIAHNGAQIYHLASKKFLHDVRLDSAITRRIIGILREEGIFGQVYTDTEIVTWKHAPELDRYRLVIHMPFIIAEDPLSVLQKPTSKCVAICYEPERLARVREKLSSWCEGHFEICQSAPHLLEMAPLGETKGSALLRLAAHLGVPRERTLAAGDQENDIAMLQAAGFGCAMANASEKTKAAADGCTQEDNDHDGLVPLLRSFFAL